ncbi:MAG: hypothetical protein PHV07_05740, partial [Oscillospiraceae bacterium]|nr:hypothetical protein [Oscillospiraceae bacterium]
APDNLSANEHSMFFLGSIAPDAVSVDRFADKAIRWAAHLRENDLDLWQENVKSFYKANQRSYQPSYLKGYVFHIITDIVWDRFYNPYLYKYLTLMGVKSDMLRTRRWSELHGYEESQLQSDWLINDVIPALITSVPADINSVSKQKIEQLKVQVINKDFPKAPPQQFLSREIMDTFYSDIIKTADIIL